MNITTTPIEKLTELGKHGTIQTFTKDEIIIRTDQAPPGVFLIKEGYIKAYSITDAGDENLHIIYGPNMIFPIIWAITGKLRQVFYEAMDDVSVYRIDRDMFLTFISEDPVASNALLHRVIDMFNVYADRVDNLEYTHSYSRIVYRLLKLAQQYGEQGASGTLIKAPVKHYDIANSTNCSRETVSREMEKLEKKGLIMYQNHHILVVDIDTLEKELLRS